MHEEPGEVLVIWEYVWELQSRQYGSRPYPLGVSQAQKAKKSGDEHPRLRAS